MGALRTAHTIPPQAPAQPRARDFGTDEPVNDWPANHRAAIAGPGAGAPPLSPVRARTVIEVAGPYGGGLARSGASSAYRPAVG